MEDKRRVDGHETMYEIHPIKMYLSSAWKQGDFLLGRIHSKFDRVLNLLFVLNGEDKILTILKEGNTLMPDSIILKSSDFIELKKFEMILVIKSDTDIQINQTKIILSGVPPMNGCSLEICSPQKNNEIILEEATKQIASFMEQSEKQSDFFRLPERYSDLLDKFIIEFLNNDTWIMEDSFLKLIGAGNGLTPAADDGLIGALAGCYLWLSLNGKLDIYFYCSEVILLHLRNKKLTTDISCKYLKCACLGEFSEDLYELLRSIFQEKRENRTALLKKIAATGHSSGMDMLYGLLKTLKYIEKFE